MSDIVLLDTSVYLNVLDVPSFNQDYDSVIAEFKSAIERQNFFLLPMASVWETGNHIARLSEGALRRKYAGKFVADVTQAILGRTPYRATYFPKKDEFADWLKDFPNAAMRNKSLADHSIVKEWERTCDLNPHRRVRI
jgi:hypothetical protein